jgi:uncharacterized small protein (DUF1192 family)
MDDDDRPRPGEPQRNYGAASLLADESLDSYSRNELDVRIALLEAEIARVAAHRQKSDAHKLAAEAFFKPKPA